MSSTSNSTCTRKAGRTARSQTAARPPDRKTNRSLTQATNRISTDDRSRISTLENNLGRLVALPDEYSKEGGGREHSGEKSRKIDDILDCVSE